MTKTVSLLADSANAAESMKAQYNRHNAAILNPHPGFEAAMVRMLRGWEQYALAHRKACDAPIGDDGVLGSEWQAVGEALNGLLIGDIGRLDGGTVDSFIRGVMEANGVEVKP